MIGKDLTLEDAFQVFGRSFTFLRNIFDPSEMVSLGGLFLVRDVPGARGKPRTAQVFVVDCPVDVVLGDLRSLAGTRYLLCVLVPLAGSLEDSKRAYKAAGFRLMGGEPMFRRRLIDLPVPMPESPFTVRRVETGEAMDAVTRQARSKQMRHEDLGVDNAAIRLYAVEVPDGVAGWVRSVRTGRDTYVSNLYVQQPYRRRGIATAMMARLLADDQRLGAHFNVLLASTVGSKLYPALGYEQIGTLQVFSPPNSK